MKSFVKFSPVPGIICLYHAIDLAVIDVFYKKKKIKIREESDNSDYVEEVEVPSYVIASK